MTAITASLSRARGLLRPLLSARIAATLPGIAGMVLISFGASLIYLPAGLIIGGVLLLRIDARL
jgi:hypothetical protein